MNSGRAAASSGTEALSSSDQIVREIVRGLHEGRFSAGQRLAEPDLVKRYGVARSTVREAIKRLAAEGIVTLHPFRGAQIRHLTRAQARNMLLVLELLVGLAARQAAERIGEAGNRARMRRSIEALLALRGTGHSYELVRAKSQFYRAITQIAGNEELERLLPNIQVHVIRAQLRFDPEQRFEDYGVMADAILAADKQRAEAAGRQQIARVITALASMPDNAFSSTTAGGETTR
jgi:DNA-binding GntR family transcriptional regulator